MLYAFVVFVERDHIGDGLFLTLIAAYDELKFDTHTGASPGSSGRGMIQAIVPELIYNPQHLPALVSNVPQALSEEQTQSLPWRLRVFRHYLGLPAVHHSLGLSL